MHDVERVADRVFIDFWLQRSKHPHAWRGPRMARAPPAKNAGMGGFYVIEPLPIVCMDRSN
jgi:hypothetical protein